MSKRKHLEQVERQLGHRPKDLESPVDFPSPLAHVWVAFCTLSSVRTSGFSGVNPISFTEIKNWCELTENKLTPREISVITQIDQTYRRVANE